MLHSVPCVYSPSGIHKISVQRSTSIWLWVSWVLSAYILLPKFDPSNSINYRTVLLCCGEAKTSILATPLIACWFHSLEYRWRMWLWIPAWTSQVPRGYDGNRYTLWLKGCTNISRCLPQTTYLTPNLCFTALRCKRFRDLGFQVLPSY